METLHKMIDSCGTAATFDLEDLHIWNHDRKLSKSKDMWKRRLAISLIQLSK